MRYSECKLAIVELFKALPTTPVYVSGKPGLGKTAMAYEVGAEMGIAPKHVAIFRPSLRDPVDLMGAPRINDRNETEWCTPGELAKLRKGRWLLCIDEMPQAVVMMQNALAGLMLDRVVGELKLSPEVFIMATGNRTKDKAGANRVVSQLANRVMHLELEAHLDDWTDWALTHEIDNLLISFLRFRPHLLCEFDADRFSNPTPRSWERVGRLPTHLPDGLYMSMVSGLVGEGPAAEYIGYRKIALDLPNPDAVLLDPKKARVPEEPGAMYAMAGAMANKASKDNLELVCQYVDRMPVEFGVLCIKDIMKRDATISGTPAFTAWCVHNQGVLL